MFVVHAKRTDLSSTKKLKRYAEFIFIESLFLTAVQISQPAIMIPQQAQMGQVIQNPFDAVMRETRFFPPESSAPLNGEQWAIVGAETQVFQPDVLVLKWHFTGSLVTY
jgi:hypothetical protein